jgi:hypothetical protein
MRTALASETIEIAFMLCCFQREGAPLTIPLLHWARKTLAQNEQLTPEQIDYLNAHEEPAHA